MSNAEIAAAQARIRFLETALEDTQIALVNARNDLDMIMLASHPGPWGIGPEGEHAPGHVLPSLDLVAQYLRIPKQDWIPLTLRKGYRVRMGSGMWIITPVEKQP